MPEPNYPVELTPPDIEPYRTGNTGVEYVTTFDSGAAGPHVLVTALTHGNEICGALVVDRLLREGLRPTRGTLTLAFNNVAAFGRFDPRNPYASRFVDEDFNRVWTRETLDGPRRSAELSRARQIRPFVEAADFLLDIHSMLEPSPPVMICGPLEKGIRFAFDIGIPAMIASASEASSRLRNGFSLTTVTRRMIPMTAPSAVRRRKTLCGSIIGSLAL